MSKKWNGPRGEFCVSAKLTEKQVQEIRELLAGGKYYQWEIAQMYDVAGSTITRIKHDNTWKHLPRGGSKKVSEMRKLRTKLGVRQ